ncbi:hypothetical protein EGW08_020138, partial [Elysia chlorotica]
LLLQFLLQQLHLPLPARQPVLDVCVVQDKVAHDDRNSEGDHEQPCHGAARPDKIPGRGLRVHVAIAHCCHGNDRPPEADWDVGEDAVRLGEVYECGEHDHADEQEDAHEHQLVKARLERVQQDPQSRHVPDEPEDPEQAQDPQDKQHLHDGDALLALAGPNQQKHDLHVVRRERQEVHDVLQRAQEVELVGRAGEAGHVLQREEGQAAYVHDKQRGVRQLAVPPIGRVLVLITPGPVLMLSHAATYTTSSPSRIHVHVIVTVFLRAGAAHSTEVSPCVVHDTRWQREIPELNVLNIEELVEGGQVCHIPGLHLEQRMRLGAEREDGNEDEDDGDPGIH